MRKVEFITETSEPDESQLPVVVQKTVTHRHEGYLLGWSVDYEELQQGVGQFPVAIVELPNGKVVTPPATSIRFLP